MVSLADKPILHDITFGIKEGAFVGLIGPNGSGKTTLLRTLAGLIPYSGLLTLEHRDIKSWSTRTLAQRLAFVRQHLNLPFDFKVEEVVLLGCLPHKRWLDPINDIDREKARQALLRLNLESFIDRPITSLSGGELRRVFLAQALVQETNLLLLDEPTTYLDVYHQFEFLEHVTALVETGHTILAVFHNLEQAARYAHHLLVLDHGRVVADGPPVEVLTEPLIRDVFRMEARVEVNNECRLRIQYIKPYENIYTHRG
jgi:iron complex transport system ATP-binding protein